MELSYLFITIAKMAALIAWIYGLMWGLARKPLWQKALTVLLAFGVIQIAFLVQFGDFSLFSAFDQGLLFQAVTMTMVCLGLNLIYGFNGQFSLAQWGFYGIGAYVAADITYRWTNADASGFMVVGLGVILAGLAMVGVGRVLRMRRGIPVLSAFTFYLIAVLVAGVVAVIVGNAIAGTLAPLFGTTSSPGVLASPVALQIVFFLAVIFAGVFAAEVSFIFGLPGPDPGKRLLRDCHPGVCHRDPDPHGEQRHDPSLPRDEGRTRDDRDPEGHVLGNRVHFPHHRDRDSQELRTIQHGAGVNVRAGR